VAGSGPLLFDPLHEALGRYARLDYLRRLRVVPAELGGEAGLVGAAALIVGPAAAAVTGMGTEPVDGTAADPDPAPAQRMGTAGSGTGSIRESSSSAK
jgi:hypothetical protein